MVLRSLPEYFNLTTALKTRLDNELTIELIKLKLTDEVAKRGSRSCSNTELKGDVEKQKKTVLCNYCQKPRHKQRQCRTILEKRNEDVKSNKRQEKHYHPNARVAREVFKNQSSQNFSFLALLQVSGRDVWIIDSGATSDMCVNPNSFEKLDRSVVQEVPISNGRQEDNHGRYRLV